MTEEREYLAERLRDQVLDDMSPDGILDAVGDGLVTVASGASSDPVEHPMSYRSASHEQRAGLDMILAGLKRYVSHAVISESAVDAQADLVEMWGAA